MPILNIQLGQTGLVGVQPKFDYILTSDSVATILTTGYLNHSVDAGFSFSQGDLVNVITQETPASRARAGIYQVDHNGTNWNLIPITSSLLLTAGQYLTSGGSATETLNIAGVQATDLLFTQVVDNGTNNVSILQAVCTANQVIITFSGNPGADTFLNYQILRP